MINTQSNRFALSNVRRAAVVLLALSGLAVASVAAGCSGSGAEQEEGSSAALQGPGGGGSGEYCKEASDCTGALPQICELCGDTFACAHHVCDEHRCAVAICPALPPPPPPPPPPCAPQFDGGPIVSSCPAPVPVVAH
jgi:hypothetical protein